MSLSFSVAEADGSTRFVRMVVEEAAGAEEVVVNTSIYKCKLYLCFIYFIFWH